MAAQSVGDWAEMWRVLGLSHRPQEVFWYLQSTAEVPLSKVLNPEMLIWGPAINWRLNQGWKTAFAHCVPSTHLVI